MNKKLVLLTIGLLLTIVVQPAVAYDVVIDPGHGGDEQNRGGPAFTVDNIGSTLAVNIPAGELQIIVNDADQFTTDTEPHDYTHIMVGTENCTVAEVNYEDNIIELSSQLDNSHSAGDPVTVQDFLVQAMGQKDSGILRTGHLPMMILTLSSTLTRCPLTNGTTGRGWSMMTARG